MCLHAVYSAVYPLFFADLTPKATLFRNGPLPKRPSAETTPIQNGYFYVILRFWLVIFVYLSSLPVAHLSDAPRRRLVVMGDRARIQDETTDNSAWFFHVFGV